MEDLGNPSRRPDPMTTQRLSRFRRLARSPRGVPLLLCAAVACAVAHAVVVTGPPARTTSGYAGGSVVFSAARHDAIAVTGTYDPASVVSIAVDPPAGTGVALASTAGLASAAGCGGGAACQFAGSAAAVTAALNAGVAVSSAAGVVGPRELVVNVTLAGAVVAAGRFTFCFHVSPSVEAARSALLAGVTALPVENPGFMVAFGNESFIVTRYPGANTVADGPLVAAASWGAGRVVAVPSLHTLDTYSFGGSASTFYTNVVTWLARSASKGVKLVVLDSRNAPFFTNAGYTNVVTADMTNPAGLTTALAGASVLWAAWMGTILPTGSLTAIRAFVAGSGGGIALAEYGIGYTWWWNMALPVVPGNVLLREAGICFLGGNRWDSSSVATTNRPPTGETHVTVDMVLVLTNSTSGVPGATIAEGMDMMGRLFTALSPADPLYSALYAFYNRSIAGVSPTPATPVSDALGKALLTIEAGLAAAVPVRSVRKHRTADALYGAVPPSAPRVTRVVSVPTSPTKWHSTGLYLPPGELGTVVVAAAFAGKGIRVIVSGHGDDISVRASWLRVPSGVQRIFPLNAVSIEIASAFGGALYIDTTSARPLPPYSFDVTISGAVEAPYFVLGTTTNAQWVAGGLRDKPAPYAELVSPHVSISLPSSFVRGTTDMAAAVQFWNDAVAAQDSLAGYDAYRANHTGERINIDVQVSIGYLHSGYPTQGPLAGAEGLVEITTLRSDGNWGWMHEMGHQQQLRPDRAWGHANPYTFDDSVECTVNLFSAAAMDAMGTATRGGWTWTCCAVDTMDKVLVGFAAQSGARYRLLGVDYKIAMWLQLRHSFGWAPIHAFLLEMNRVQDTARATLPSTEQAKRDWFLLHMSQATGYSLTQYVKVFWGLEVSQSAVNAVAALSLPSFLPAIGVMPADVSTPRDTALSLPLATGLRSLDGVANVTGVSGAAHGTIRAGAGVGAPWVYSPAPGFVGSDSFTYTVSSSSGYRTVAAVRVSVLTDVVVHAPVTAAFTVGGPVVLSAANGTGVSISGGYSASADNVTVSVCPQGAVSVLTAGAGVTVLDGGGPTSSSVTFTGPLAAVNAVLAAGITVTAGGAAGVLLVTIATAGVDVASATVPVALNAALDIEAARTALLAGVTALPVANPGYMLVFGDQACIVTRYPGANAATDGPLVAAASWGAGRVVAVPSLHTLDTYSFGGSASTFYTNVVTWLARSASKGVKLVVLDSRNAPFFTNAGYTNVVTADVTNPAGLTTALAGASVLWAAWMGTILPTGSLTVIRAFVAGSGGGIALAEYGIGYTWWWNMALPVVPGNVLLREAGICFLGGNRWDGSSVDATNRPGAGEARPGVARVLALLQNPSSGAFTTAQRAEAAALVTGMRTVLPAGFPALLAIAVGCSVRGTHASVDTVHKTLVCAPCSAGCTACIAPGLVLGSPVAACSVCNSTAGFARASNGSVCVPACAVGEFKQLGAPDDACVAACGAGTWAAAGMGTCRACGASCGASAYVSGACVATADTVCAACSAACAGCTGPTPLECASCSAAAPLRVLGACVPACPSWMLRIPAGDACAACASECGECDGAGAAACETTAAYVELSVTVGGAFVVVDENTASALRAAAAAVLGIDLSRVRIKSVALLEPTVRAVRRLAAGATLVVTLVVKATNSASADVLAASAVSLGTPAAWLAALHAAGLSGVTAATPGALAPAVVLRPVPPAPPPPPASPVGIIAGCSVGAVVVGAAVTWLWFRRRQERQRVKAAGPSKPATFVAYDVFGGASPIQRQGAK